MAVNVSGKFGPPPEGPSNQGTLSNLLNSSDDLVPRSQFDITVDQLKVEIAKLKQGSKAKSKDFDAAVEDIKCKMEAGHKFLPKFVVSNRHQVTHINHRVLLYAPAARWGAICDYHSSDGEDTKVSCTKCLGIAQSKEVEEGDSASPVGGARLCTESQPGIQIEPCARSQFSSQRENRVLLSASCRVGGGLHSATVACLCKYIYIYIHTHLDAVCTCKYTCICYLNTTKCKYRTNITYLCVVVV